MITVWKALKLWMMVDGIIGRVAGHSIYTYSLRLCVYHLSAVPSRHPVSICEISNNSYENTTLRQ